MLKHSITANRNIISPIKDRVAEGDVKKYQIDFSAWAEDNATLTGATWTVESGTVSVSNQSLSSNIATANITATGKGKALVSLSGTDGTLVKKVYLDLEIINPEEGLSDYV